MSIPQILMLYRSILESGLAAALRDPVSEEGVSYNTDSLYTILRYHVGLYDEKGHAEKALGKMLRPSLLLFTTQELKGDVKRALPAAVALELVHNFSLIHDDIQDHDELRRGRSTVWKLIGMAQAINAGDLMYSIATREALVAGTDAAGAIIDAARVMIEGQGLDLAFEDRWVNAQAYTDMIDKKTGALICCAFRTGGIIAHADATTLDMLLLLGREMGRAFQIRDDLLGVWGDGNITGKPQGSDIRRKKKSFPIALTMQRADEKGRMLLKRVYAKDEISDNDVAHVIGLMTDLGVKESGEETVERYLKEASGYLERLPLSEEGRGLMNELIVYLARREK